LRERKISALPPLVVVLALDKNERTASFALACELRGAGIRAESYVGDGGMKAQFRYADRRNAVIAVIEGADERARGEVTIKDLVAGAEMAKSVESRAAWVKDRPAQISVPRTQLVTKVREMLGPG
jgi:histidyl-tRNA synthetase